MNLKDLEGVFETAIEQDLNYIAVKVETEGYAALEVIINPKENFEAKLDYYQKAYNEDLTLRVYSGIRIIDAIASNHFELLETTFEEDYK